MKSLMNPRKGTFAVSAIPLLNTLVATTMRRQERPRGSSTCSKLSYGQDLHDPMDTPYWGTSLIREGKSLPTVKSVGYAYTTVSKASRRRRRCSPLACVSIWYGSRLIWRQRLLAHITFGPFHSWFVVLAEAYFMNTTTVASYVLLSRWLTPFGLNSHARKIQDEKTASKEYEKT